MQDRNDFGKMWACLADHAQNAVGGQDPLTGFDAVLASPVEQEHIVQQVGGRVDDFAGRPKELIAVHRIGGPGCGLAQLGAQCRILRLQASVVRF